MFKRLKAMKIKRHEERLSALDEILVLLQQSSDSAFAVVSIKDLVNDVLVARKAIETGTRREVEDKVALLVAPTCALQDTAIDNGWGDKYLELAARIG